MPIIMPAKTPTRVTIGEPIDTTPVESRRSPALVQQTTTSRRPAPKTMWVVKDGEEPAEVTIFNARDLITHHGWHEYVEAVAEGDEDAGEPDPTDNPDDVGVRGDRESNPELKQLDELRAELAKRGVVVDMRKGIKKLTAELALLKAHDPIDVPATAPVVMSGIADISETV